MDHLNSSEVMIFLIFIFLLQFVHSLQIREMLKFKVPYGSYFAYNLSNIKESHSLQYRHQAQFFADLDLY